MLHNTPELLLSLALLLISLLSNAYSSQSNGPYTAIFSFGNSYADTGNSIRITKDLVSYDNIAHAPYGMTYFDQPTGRCSDGRLVVDFIAQDLGLPFVPAYFSQGQDFGRGANFAVNGAHALSFDFLHEQACRNYFSKCLFLLGEIGGNDSSFALSSGKSISEVMSYVPVIMNTIREAAETLLNQGAFHLVLPEMVAKGCLPRVLANYASTKKSDYDHLGCLKEYNAIALYHNMKLKELIEQLRDNYPQARIIYADYYEPVIQFLQNPNKFGFTNGAPLRVCCGGGGPYNYNLTAFCGYPGVLACSDPSTYINWDGTHLTEAAYRIIAKGWMKGHYAHPPILSAVYSNDTTVHDS